MSAFEGGVIDHGGAHEQGACGCARAWDGEGAAVGAPSGAGVAGVLQGWSKVDAAVGGAGGGGVVDGSGVGQCESEGLTGVGRDGENSEGRALIDGDGVDA